MTKDEIKRFVITSNYSLIISHYNPDEDAVGASLAIQYLLSEVYNIKTHVIFPNKPSFSINNINYLKNNNNVFYFLEDNITEKDLYEALLSADRIYFIDMSVRERFPAYHNLLSYLEQSCIKEDGEVTSCAELGFVLKILKDKVIHIDHRHIIEMPVELQYAKIKFVDPQSTSTCEVISKYFIENIISKEQIPKEVASLLLFGILGDTNHLSITTLSESTFLEIAKLMTYGKVSYEDVINMSYRNKNKNILMLKNEIISKKTVFIPGKKTIFFYIDKATADYYKVKNGIKYVMDDLLSMNDYDFFVGIEEVEGGVSVWVRGYDYNKIKRAADILGYKGHKNVATAFIPGVNLKEAYANYIRDIID